MDPHGAKAASYSFWGVSKEKLKLAGSTPYGVSQVSKWDAEADGGALES
jgi:hypothetical protein